MKFLICEEPNIQPYSLVYEDRGFGIDPFMPWLGHSAVQINYLSLQINFDCKIVYVWGYCPITYFQKTDEFPQEYESRSLVALLNKEPIPGVSYRIDNRDWPMFVNLKKGWVCLGTPQIKNKRLIQFAPDCIATMEDDKIIAVWLHPKKFPELKFDKD